MRDTFQNAEANAIDTRNFGESLDDFGDLAAWFDRHLNGSGSWSCRAVWSRRKSSQARSYKVVRWFKRRPQKSVVEFEVAAPDAAGGPALRYIVKLRRRDRTRGSYEALSRLWEAGFRPPSPYTVVRPVAYLADDGLLVQEKAPGAPLIDLILRKEDNASDAVTRAAGWLAALHTSTVEVPPRREQVIAAVARYGKELSEILPTHASRIRRVAARVLGELESSTGGPSVPSHGDFHPTNVFISEGRVTVIDLDTFGGQEAAADVAYFLAQTAIMGFFRRGSFAATSAARDGFLRAYEDAGPPLLRSRLVLYLGMAFLQSLHYELWVLRNDKPVIIEPWLHHCERSLLDGASTLT